MRVIGLVSGGKDSVYNLVECVRHGHTIAALGHLRPPRGTHELDSFMYQTVASEAVAGVAECLALPLHVREIAGAAVSSDLAYTPQPGDEVEGLHALLAEIVAGLQPPRADGEQIGVSSGAIWSTYQKNRVENVCSRLGLVSLAYLWERDQSQLLDEVVHAAGLTAIVVKVACLGLDASHLGKTLLELQPWLEKLRERYQANVCGEGGEYETLVLDCPLFKRRLVIDKSEVVVHSKDMFAPVAYLRIDAWHTEPK